MVRLVSEMARLPSKTEIEDRARELWHEDMARRNDPSFSIEPELEELREEGFLCVAQSELMRDQYRRQIEGEYIDYAEKFDVDVKELFEANGLILGSRHTGKSDIAMRICDRAKKKAIIVVFDPSQDWMKRSSIGQYMKLERVRSLDVPTESMIYDISLLGPMQQADLVENFSKRLFEFQAKTPEPKQYLIIFEEAHTYFPQGCMRAKRLQNTVKLLSVGRNLNVACVLISQFASMIDKFAVKHAMAQAWFGFTREPNDLRYLRQILGEEVEELGKLEDGEFVYLNRNKTSKINIEPYFNNSAKTEIIKESRTIEEKPKSIKNKDQGKNLTSLTIAFMWLLAIIYAASQKVLA